MPCDADACGVNEPRARIRAPIADVDPHPTPYTPDKSNLTLTAGSDAVFLLDDKTTRFLGLGHRRVVDLDDAFHLFTPGTERTATLL